MNGTPSYCILKLNMSYIELNNSVLVETARFPRIQFALGMDLKLNRGYGIGRLVSAFGIFLLNFHRESERSLSVEHTILRCHKTNC